MFRNRTFRPLIGTPAGGARALAGGLVLLAMAACGGGGGGGGASDFPAQGVYWGQTGSGRLVLGMVRDDGAFWMIYSRTTDGVIAGAVQGTAKAEDGVFTSTNAKDLNAEEGAVYDTRIDASYSPQDSLSGIATYDFGSNSFTLTYDPNYEETPSLSRLAGSYYGGALTGNGSSDVTVTITSRGELSGHDADDCRFSGSASPDHHGNLFNLSVKFDGGSCALGTSSVEGIAYYDGTQLFAVAVNDSRDNGFIFLGQ